jgi:hypothetical protein
LVDRELSRPVYDSDRARIFIEQQLYVVPDKADRDLLLRAWGRDDVHAFREGVHAELFTSLAFHEYKPPEGQFALDTSGGSPRAVLITYFGYPASVSVKDRPMSNALRMWEMAGYVSVLPKLTTEKQKQAAYGLFKRSDVPEELAAVCIRLLENQGYNEEFADYCRRRITESSPNKAGFQALLERLQKSGKN